jgi:hypothetical protein
MREFWTCLMMNYLFFAFSKQLIIGAGSRYHSADLLSEQVVYPSYHDSESCRIDVLDLIQFVDKGFALVLVRS